MALRTAILALDIVTLAATIALFVQAYRAHRSIRTTTTFALTTCFAFISIGILTSLIAEGVFNVEETLTPFFADLLQVGIEQQLGVLLSVFFVLAGYTVLLLVVERVSNMSMWVLVFLLVLVTVFLARNVFFISHVIALVLLALLTFRFKQNYDKRKSTDSLLVASGFGLITFAHAIAFLLPLSELFHTAFLALRLIGFFLIFAMAWRVATR